MGCWKSQLTTGCTGSSFTRYQERTPPPSWPVCGNSHSRGGYGLHHGHIEKDAKEGQIELKSHDGRPLISTAISSLLSAFLKLIPPLIPETGTGCAGEPSGRAETAGTASTRRVMVAPLWSNRRRRLRPSLRR